MNATEFTRLFAEKTGVSLKFADAVCQSFVTVLKSVLFEDNQDVSFYGFGSFTHVRAKERHVIHPKTGESITIPARDLVKFRQSETIDSTVDDENTEDNEGEDPEE